MSATLDAEPVAELIGGAPLVTSEGRAFPVETRWLDRPWSKGAPRRGQFETAVADLVCTALDETEGGVLVFLPGRGEISRVERLLAGRLKTDIVIQTLHGGLRPEVQRAALRPLREGRKLVLSTSIAETSLTIPDVRVVVDGGRARRSRFDPGSGMARLVTEPVTRAEAEQRQGRAGRVDRGWCFRLWTKGEEGALSAFPPPEIASADLSPLALELAMWGASGPDDLAWLTPPPQSAFDEALALLKDLGAVSESGRITDHGKALAGLPVHPRLAHMLLEANSRGAGEVACNLAALVENRDPLSNSSSDLSDRLKALRGKPVAFEIDWAALNQVRAEAKRLRRLLPKSSKSGSSLSAGAVLSLAYPDRIAQRRTGEAPRYLLTGGKGAVAAPQDPIGTAHMLVVGDLDGNPREALIRRALVAAESEIRDLHAKNLRQDRVCEWSRRTRSVMARERLMLGAVALEDRRWAAAPPEAIAQAMTEGVRDLGIEALPWDAGARRFAARVEWLRARGERELPDFSPDGLMAEVEHWLMPHLSGIRRADQLAQLDLLAALQARLTWSERESLDRLAPAAITAPTGTRLPVNYADDPPSVSVRLQELYGLSEHPAVGPDRMPLLLHLLSPAQRPVQTTSDLPGFWASSYSDVRRDLRGRYPKHSWPEDPANAVPTRRTRKPRDRSV